MRLTTKGRYAVTAMLDLAFNSQNNPVTLTEIATRQTISLSYLEQLFARLRKAEIVIGVRGPGGGYQLSELPEKSVLRQLSRPSMSRLILQNAVEKRIANMTAFA